jgi:hypothetical protein
MYTLVIFFRLFIVIIKVLKKVSLVLSCDNMNKTFDPRVAAEFEQVLVLSCVVVPIDTDDRYRYILDNTGKQWLKYALARVSALTTAGRIVRRDFVSDAALLELARVNDVHYTLQEESLLGLKNDLQIRFEHYFMMEGLNSISAKWATAERIIEQLKAEHLRFLQPKSGSLEYVVDVEYAEDPTHIPYCLLLAERLHQADNSPTFALKEVDFKAWKNETMQLLKEERVRILAHEHQQFLEFVGRENEPPMTEELPTIRNVAELTVQMYKLLPMDGYDEMSMIPLEFRKKSLSKKEEKDLEKRKAAYMFHRLDIFHDIIGPHGNREDTDDIRNYFYNGNEKYKQPYCRHQMTDERAIMKQRFCNAWTNTMKPIDGGSIFPLPEKPAQKSCRAEYRDLMASGVIPYPNIDVVCLTPRTEAEVIEHRERIERSVDALHEYFAVKPEPTTPPTEVTPPPEEDTTASAPPNEEEGEHILIRVMTAICSQHIFEGFCSLLKIPKNSDKKCSRAFLTGAFD